MKKISSIIFFLMLINVSFAQENNVFKNLEQQITFTSTIEEDLIKNGTTVLYIEFDLGTAKIYKESLNIVNELIQVLEKNPSWQVSIEGHTDNSGSNKRNKQLSLQRAEAVYQVMLNNGIAKTRLEYKGFGSDFPVTNNNSEENRAKNRRVEIIKK